MVSENRCLYELAPLEIMLLLRGATEVVTPKPTSVPLVGEAMGQVVRHPHADVLIDGNQIVEIGQNLEDRKSTRLNSSHALISYAVFCLKKKKQKKIKSVYIEKHVKLKN